MQGENQSFRAEFLKASVYDAEQFQTKKKSLIQRKALVDPNLRKYTQVKSTIRQRDIESFIAPTIDQVYKITNEVKEKLTPKKKRPLTEIISIRSA